MKMIEAWRSAWGQQQYYFGIVQLPNYRPVANDPGDSEWAALREAQRLAAQSLPDTGLAVTIDLAMLRTDIRRISVMWVSDLHAGL